MKLLPENSYILDDVTKNAAKALFASETENFVALVKLCNLDAKHDFKHANLQGIDFSNCDLRGFDFSGADLEGSFGINLVVDQSTILLGANTAGSVFENEQTVREIESHDSDILKEINRLKGKHWTEAALWILDKISPINRNEVKLTALIVRLFEYIPEARTTLLKAAKGGFSDKTKYKTFLQSVALRSDIPVSAQSVVSKELAANFLDDPAVSQYFFALLNHRDNSLRAIGISALLASKWTAVHKEEVVNTIAKEKFAPNRQFYIRRLAEGLHKQTGLHFDIFLRDLETYDEYLDWIYPVEKPDIETLARKHIAVFSRWDFLSNVEIELPNIIGKDKLEEFRRNGAAPPIELREKIIIRIFERAISSGIPYVLGNSIA